MLDVAGSRGRGMELLLDPDGKHRREFVAMQALSLGVVLHGALSCVALEATRRSARCRADRFALVEDDAPGVRRFEAPDRVEPADDLAAGRDRPGAERKRAG